MFIVSGKVKAVAFDAVGTLIEPCPSVAEAYRLAAVDQGVDVPADTISGRFRKAFASDDASGEHATDDANERRRWRRIVAECLPELPPERVDPAFDRLWEHFADPTNWRLFPDVLALIECLTEADVRMCVASNFDSRLRRVCDGLGLGELLGHQFVISSEVGVRKPGQAFYEAVTAKLGHSASEILFVGDDLVNDFQVPEALGFEVVLVDRRDRFGERRSVTSLTDLMPMFASVG
jgi:putative hydrolase of the HAD superfamily